jgi:mRNA interferase MazF
MEQYEVFLANLNPQKGTEVGKVRPVVIIQSDLLNKDHQSLIICPLSTNIIPDMEFLRVDIEARENLTENSQVLIDQARAIDKKRLIKRLTRLSDAEIEVLQKNLKLILFSEF